MNLGARTGLETRSAARLGCSASCRSAGLDLVEAHRYSTGVADHVYVRETASTCCVSQGEAILTGCRRRTWRGSRRCAAHNRGDLDALVELYDPEAVFETLLLGTHHGNEAIRLIYEENQKTLSGYDVIPVELIDAGDSVVAVAQTVGSGPASEIAVDDRFAFVFTFKGNRIVREQAFRNRDEALQAAGLSAA